MCVEAPARLRASRFNPYLLIYLLLNVSETTAARHGPQLAGELPDREEDRTRPVQ